MTWFGSSLVLTKLCGEDQEGGKMGKTKKGKTRPPVLTSLVADRFKTKKCPSFSREPRPAPPTPTSRSRQKGPPCHRHACAAAGRGHSRRRREGTPLLAPVVGGEKWGKHRCSVHPISVRAKGAGVTLRLRYQTEDSEETYTLAAISNPICLFYFGVTAIFAARSVECSHFL